MKVVDHWRAWSAGTKFWTVVIMFLGVCGAIVAIHQSIEEARFRKLPLAEQQNILEHQRLARIEAARVQREEYKRIKAERVAQGRVPVRVEIEDGAFSRVLSNPGTTPDRTGGMRLWRNVPGT